MVEKRTQARPYAKAIFELASQFKNYQEWSNMLKTLTFIAENDQVKRLLHDTSQSPQKVAEFFISVAGSNLDEYGKNLVRTLASGRRLIILPEIQSLYESFRNQAENILPAICFTAVPLSNQQKEQFIEDLSKRFDRKIQMTFHIQDSLIGGFLIKAGDTVIDGSVRGQLKQLKETMSGG